MTGGKFHLGKPTSPGVGECSLYRGPGVLSARAPPDRSTVHGPFERRETRWREGTPREREPTADQMGMGVVGTSGNQLDRGWGGHMCPGTGTRDLERGEKRIPRSLVVSPRASQLDKWCLGFLSATKEYIFFCATTKKPLSGIFIVPYFNG